MARGKGKLLSVHNVEILSPERISFARLPRRQDAQFARRAVTWHLRVSGIAWIQWNTDGSSRLRHGLLLPWCFSDVTGSLLFYSRMRFWKTRLRMYDRAKAHGSFPSCEILDKLASARANPRAIETRLKFDFSGLTCESRRREREREERKKRERKRSRGWRIYIEWKFINYTNPRAQSRDMPYDVYILV